MYVFVTSFLSPHVSPFLVMISQKIQEKIIVIECMNMTQERKDLGYFSAIDTNFFEMKSLIHERELCLELISKADVVEYAWHIPDLLHHRIKYNKLTFIENERLLKKGLIKFLDIKLWKQLVFNLRVRSKNFYFLSAGDYAAKDYKTLGFNSNKILRFGYFPKTVRYDNVFSLKKDFGPLQCLWVGRLIPWKRTSDAIYAMKHLPQDLVSLNIIGDGQLKLKIHKLIRKLNLNNVHLLGLLSLDNVRKEMLKADVLICSSSKEEGWGAVINEAMNSGCVVVSTTETGASPNLIIDNYNGFVYDSANIGQLVSKLNYLLQDKSLCREIGLNAYNSITLLWNEDVAATRLLEWINGFNKGYAVDFDNGPCSKVFN